MLYIFDSEEKLLAVFENKYCQTTEDEWAFILPFLPTEIKGKQSICPYYDPVHTEKLPNGSNTLENTFTFSVPANHVDSQYVVENNFVGFKDLDNNWQIFEVKEITEIDSGSEISKHVFCEHILYELLDDIVSDLRPSNTSASLALTDALSESRWEVGTVDNLGTNSTTFYYSNALSNIQDVASVWQGELQFRLVVTGNVITHRYVDLLASRGNVTGKQFVVGKDIDKVERNVNSKNLVTALYGRGKGEQVDTGGYGRRITFADIEWTSPTNPANKPLDQEWVGDETALALYGRAGGTRHRFDTFVDDQETDATTLLQKTWDELQRRNTPIVSYVVNAVDLETLAGLSYEAVRIGDTVAVIDQNFAVPLQTTARVLAISRNLLDPLKTIITLGNYGLDTGTLTLNQKKLNQRVSDKSGVWDNATAIKPSVLDSAVFELQNILRATGGYLDFIPGEGMICYDTPDPADATKAIKLGGGILAIANSKTSGEWNWTTFGTGDGFVADLVLTGYLIADRIRGGTLTLGGEDDGNGILRILNALGAEVVRGDNTGITVDGGSYFIKEGNLGSTIIPKQNLVYDHSFELLAYDYTGQDATYKDMPVYIGGSSILTDRFYPRGWSFTGTPRMLNYGSGAYGDIPNDVAFGNSCLIVDASNYVISWHLNKNVSSLMIYEPTPPLLTVCFASVYAKRGDRSVSNAQLCMDIKCYSDESTLIGTVSGSNITLTTSWARVGQKFTLLSNTRLIKIILKGVNGWVYIDGVQVVADQYPAVYDPEQSLWLHLSDYFGANQHRFLSDIYPGYIFQESWHEIGVAGEPSLENSWVYYDDGGTPNWNTPGYFKDSNGIVHLKGLIRDGTTSTTIFTLPAGYRPAMKHMFSCASHNGTTYVLGRVDIDSSGLVVLTYGGTTFLSLDNISFRAEQ